MLKFVNDSEEIIFRVGEMIWNASIVKHVP